MRVHFPRHVPRNDDDDWEDYGSLGGVGSVSTLISVDPEDAKPLPRAFPPGFHVAAPGPSRDEVPAAPKRAARKKA